MSYGGGYGQSGYGQSNPYGGRQDPYGGRPDPYSQQQQPPRRDPYGQQQQPPPRQDPYGQQQPPRRDPYGQQQPPRRDPYGQQQPPRRDPYGQKPPSRQDTYGQQQPPRQDPYGQRPPQQAKPQRPAQANGNGDVEMGSVKPQQSYAPAATEPPYDAPPPAYGGADILDECRKINNGTEEIERDLAKLENAQRAVFNESTIEKNSPAVREVEYLNTEIMNSYRNLLDKMKYIKKKPGAGSDLNSKHIGLADRKLQSSRQRYLQVEASYRNRTREQTERQFKVAFPDASPQEVRDAAENPDGNLFANALMNSDRRGQSSQILSAVRQRHDAIQKIEQQMIELAKMFEDMERMVVEQEVMVERVEQGAVETHENVEQGNVELTGAVDKARAARRKKWICFGICVAIILVIIVIILIYGATQGWFKSKDPNPPKPQ